LNHIPHTVYVTVLCLMLGCEGHRTRSIFNGITPEQFQPRRKKQSVTRKRSDTPTAQQATNAAGDDARKCRLEVVKCDGQLLANVRLRPCAGHCVCALNGCALKLGFHCMVVPHGEYQLCHMWYHHGANTARFHCTGKKHCDELPLP
jgi:hypothetical protein